MNWYEKPVWHMCVYCDIPLLLAFRKREIVLKRRQYDFDIIKYNQEQPHHGYFRNPFGYIRRWFMMRDVGRDRGQGGNR